MTQKCSPIKNSIPFCAIYFTCNGKNSNVNAKLLYAIGAKIYKMAYVNHYSVKKEVNYWRKNMQTQKYLWSIIIHKRKIPQLNPVNFCNR